MSLPAGKGSTSCHTRAGAPPAGEQDAGRRLTVALRAWLEWHGLHQEDLAAVLGVSDSSVFRIVAPSRSPRRDGALGRLVAVLVDPEAGLCPTCGILLPDGPLADELRRLLALVKL